MINIIKDLELYINKFIEYLREQLAGIRGGRSTPKLVENISVDYLGQKLTIKQLGSISIVPPREIRISIWDKQCVISVVKALESSNLNISANIEGNLIRINLPYLSQERRLELVKIIKKEIEETKIKIRYSRDEANKKISRQFEQGEISEDDKFRLKQEAQKLVDKSNEEVGRILENKRKEIEE